MIVSNIICMFALAKPFTVVDKNHNTFFFYADKGVVFRSTCFTTVGVLRQLKATPLWHLLTFLFTAKPKQNGRK